MIEIALGVCLGILAAVFILNWWQDHLIRRAERRERRQQKKTLTQQYRDYEAWLYAYEAAHRPPAPDEPFKPNWLGLVVVACPIVIFVICGLVNYYNVHIAF